jgi:hypothetical protein
VFLVRILSNFYLLRLALFYLNLLCLIYNVVLMCNNEGTIKIYQNNQLTNLSNNIEETFDGNNTSKSNITSWEVVHPTGFPKNRRSGS